MGGMEIAALVVGYEPSDRGGIAILSWIELEATGSERGMRLRYVPAVLMFTISSN